MEWKERKLMRKEDEALMLFFLEQQAEARIEANEEEAKMLKIEEIDQKWNQIQLASELER